MDRTMLKSALLSYWNDQTEVFDYGQGHLIYLPWHYGDDDAVALYVEEHDGLVTITDHGTTYGRIAAAAINMDTDRVHAAWKAALGPMAHLGIGASVDEISATCDVKDYPERLGQLASACLRAEQVTQLGTAPKALRFSDRVSRTVQKAVRDVRGVKAKPQAPVMLVSGRTRPVTTLVHPDSGPDVWVQAVGGNDKQAREDALERCVHLFHFGRSDHALRMAAVKGHRDLWGNAMERELRDVAQRVVYVDDAPHMLEREILQTISPQGQLT